MVLWWTLRSWKKMEKSRSVKIDRILTTLGWWRPARMSRKKLRDGDPLRSTASPLRSLSRNPPEDSSRPGGEESPQSLALPLVQGLPGREVQDGAERGEVEEAPREEDGVSRVAKARRHLLALLGLVQVLGARQRLLALVHLHLHLGDSTASSTLLGPSPKKKRDPRSPLSVCPS